MARPIPVWLDCDPGHDDATAILLAGHTPGLRLLGISTIGGNQTLAKVTQNALDVLDALGLSHIDVVAGQPRPLMRSPMLCPEIHGDTGLDGPQGGRLLPRSPRRPLLGKAINVMYDRISAAYDELVREDAAAVAAVAAAATGPVTGVTAAAAVPDDDGGAPGDGDGAPAVAAAAVEKPAEERGGSEGARPRVRLVCTGALTNTALLLTVYPEVVPMVEVAIMGGCMGIGNTGPVMEFNIQTDPESAKIVFESGVPLTMVPLEVTHTVLATPQVLADIAGGAGGESCGGCESASTETQRTEGARSDTSASAVPSLTPADAAAMTTSAAAAAAAVTTTAAATAAGATSAVTPSCGASGISSASAGCDGSAAAVPAEAAAVRAVSAFRHTIQQLLLFFAETYKRVFHFEHPPLHDPVAVAWVIRPELFETKRMRVDVETLSVLSYGQTVCDVWGQSSQPPNVDVALRVDVAGFWTLMLEAVARADAVSPLNAT